MPVQTDVSIPAAAAAAAVAVPPSSLPQAPPRYLLYSSVVAITRNPAPVGGGATTVAAVAVPIASYPYPFLSLPRSLSRSLSRSRPQCRSLSRLPPTLSVSLSRSLICTRNRISVAIAIAITLPTADQTIGSSSSLSNPVPPLMYHCRPCGQSHWRCSQQSHGEAPHLAGEVDPATCLSRDFLGEFIVDAGGCSPPPH